jgi:hypothetical protein
MEMGSKDAIEKRVSELKAQVEASSSDYDKRRSKKELLSL